MRYRIFVTMSELLILLSANVGQSQISTYDIWTKNSDVNIDLAEDQIKSGNGTEFSIEATGQSWIPEKIESRYIDDCFNCIRIEADFENESYFIDIQNNIRHRDYFKDTTIFSAGTQDLTKSNTFTIHSSTNDNLTLEAMPNGNYSFYLDENNPESKQIGLFLIIDDGNWTETKGDLPEEWGEISTTEEEANFAVYGITIALIVPVILRRLRNN